MAEKGQISMFVKSDSRQIERLGQDMKFFDPIYFYIKSGPKFRFAASQSNGTSYWSWLGELQKNSIWGHLRSFKVKVLEKVQIVLIEIIKIILVGVFYFIFFYKDRHLIKDDLIWSEVDFEISEGNFTQDAC